MLGLGLGLGLELPNPTPQPLTLALALALALTLPYPTRGARGVATCVGGRLGLGGARRPRRTAGISPVSPLDLHCISPVSSLFSPVDLP